jgi:ribonuclease HI
MKYYGVKQGKVPGIYDSWEECKKQVVGYSGAEYKSFKSREMAKKYVLSVNTTKVKKYKTKEFEAIKFSNKQNSVSIYTDGSWSNTEDSKKIYAGGFLVIDKGEIVKKECVNGDDESLAELRNVAGEMQAAVRAIHYIDKVMPNVKNIFIFVDYIGLIHWAKPREDGGWKRKNIYTQKYGRYLEKMKEKLNINFIHVKGHNKDKFNEEADKLAEYSKQLYLKKEEYSEKEFLENYSYIKKQEAIK